MSEAALRASLIDIRLPSDAAGGVWAELIVAIGAASLLAVGIAALVRLLGQKRAVSHAPTMSDRLAEIAALPPTDRRVALLHLLREVAPERYAELAPALYRPESAPDLDHLTAEVARLA